MTGAPQGQRQLLTEHSPVMHRVCRLFFCLLVLASPWAHASTLISQAFNTATFPSGWQRGGGYTPSTTNANGSSYWLRLTDTGANRTGWAYYNTAFAVNQGFVIDFEFASFGGSGADGMLMFLFDGATTTFRPGAAGGSLSYANDCAASGTADAGMSNAYIGIAFDEFGNFANQNDRCKNGGVGAALPDSVSLRGPGNWDGTGSLPSTAYSYLTSAAAGTTLDCTSCSTRPETGANWRRARITMLQSGSAWTVSVDVQFGSTASFTRLISAYPLTSAPPSTLKIGFAAATGGSNNYHDIRNVTVSNPVDMSISKTAPAEVMVNSAFNYVLTVTNAYTDPAGSVTVTDTMPTGITYNSTVPVTGGAGSCTLANGSPRVLSCSLNTMTSGETRTITISATSAGATQTSVTNTATVSQTDIDITPSNNSSSVTTTIWNAPALTVVKSAANTGGTSISSTNPGTDIVYSIQTSNTGGPSKSNVLTDTMSPFTALYLDYGGSNTPFVFSALTSGLTLGSVEYSYDNGSTWTTTVPASGGGGAPARYNGAVTNFRITLTGTMGTLTSGSTTHLLRYQTRVE